MLTPTSNTVVPNHLQWSAFFLCLVSFNYPETCPNSAVIPMQRRWVWLEWARAEGWLGTAREDRSGTSVYWIPGHLQKCLLGKMEEGAPLPGPLHHSCCRGLSLLFISSWCVFLPLELLWVFFGKNFPFLQKCLMHIKEYRSCGHLKHRKMSPQPPPLTERTQTSSPRSLVHLSLQVSAHRDAGWVVGPAFSLVLTLNSTSHILNLAILTHNYI